MSEAVRRLGKYEILGEVGKGGFATVYRARDLDLGREVALKVLDPLLMRDPVWVARFRREARAAAMLDHPHIVTIHEINQSEGALYIAMKLVEGGSLSQRIAESGPLPWTETVRLVNEIAEALDFAHGQGVLHRDLKPANVLLDSRSGAMLTDFGFASLLADNSLSVSMSGGIVGTPATMAPEVWEGADATVQADVYALGCILYEMVVGQQLFSGATPPAVMLAHFRPLTLPDQWPEDTPPGLNEVLAVALDKDPAARYASAGEMAAAVAALSVDALAEPYAALQAAVGAQQWSQALEIAAQIRASQSDYRDVAELERQALAGIEEDARAQSAAQWRTTAEEALTAGDLVATQLALKQWRKVAPDDPELTRIQEHLDGQTASVASAMVATKDEPGATDMPPVTARPPASISLVATVPPAHPPARRHSVWLAPVVLALAVLAAVVVATIALWPDRNGPSPASAPFTATQPPAQQIDTPVSPTHTPVPPTDTPVSLTDTLAQPTATPTLGIGSTMISEKDGMEFVYVPAGEFIMGSPEGEGLDDEHPQHTVYLDGYWIGRTEVTNAMFARFVEETGYRTDAEKEGESLAFTGATWELVEAADWRHPQGPERGIEGLEDHPVVQVSWNDAVAYCAWAGCRLPTEAEWEKAARGTIRRTYPWGNGDVAGDRLNFADANLPVYWANQNVDDGYRFTAPVGSYPAGAKPYSALDMAGNVWEWTADWYDSKYYASSPTGNPVGYGSGSTRVVRGGAWRNVAQLVRTAVRSSDTPDARNDNIGFRPARSP